MSYELEKFSAGTMDKGIETQQMQLLPVLLLDMDTYNLTQGIQQGLGPRYGISTIPGQNDSETLSGSRLPGLLGAEAANAAPYFARRRKVYAALPLSIQHPTTNVATKVMAFLIEGGASTQYLDVSICSTVSGVTETISPQIYDGFASPSSDTTAIVTAGTIYAEAIPPDAAGSRDTPLLTYLQSSSSRNYASSVAASVSNGFTPIRWFMGGAATAGDATHAPNVILQKAAGVFKPGATPVNVYCGVPSEFNIGNYRTTPRRVKIYTLDVTGGFNIEYSLTFTPSSTNVIPDKKGASSTVLNFSAITANKDTGGTSYASNIAVLVNDDAALMDSSYQAILTAKDKPYACFFQGAYQQTNGRFNQWIDLSQHSFDPTPSGVYTESTVVVPTSFLTWPSFVRGTPMVAAWTGAGPALGTTAGAGILRANTVYEFTYSLYNKRLNYETNVGKPVKIQTGSVDFINLQLFAPGVNLETLYDQYSSINNRFLPFQFSDFADIPSFPPAYRGTSNFINFYDYRFYFRIEGTFEWLPALTIEASQLWFRPNYPIFACTGALAATTGGQPGGFNDYSPLPNDQYIDVKVFNNRAFWCSAKSIAFSLRKNFLAYAGRNSVACPQGYFSGMMVHAYPGQAQQSSRIVIFGSEQIYVGRFTGEPLQTAVQVSPDASGVFDIEGSDFILDPWTSITAFSYRSAVNADGILHYWGPQGVYRDDGLAIPTKLSGPIEPDLFTLYDTGHADEIHGTYNPATKEIIWLYMSSVDRGGGQQMLIYNTESETFTPGRFNGQVDWLQNLNIETAAGTSGKRLIAGIRASTAATTQRGYFFDYRNRSGDIYPTTDFVIKTVETPVPGTRRLTLAAGYSAGNLATMAAGDSLAIQQFNAYTGQTTGTDLIAEISAVNTTLGYIEIALPTDAVLPNLTATYNQFFPIWHATPTGVGLNGIAYQMMTNYWAPSGVNGYYFWLYCYLLSKVRLWASDLNLGFTLSYRTPTAASLIGDTVPLADNSDGNFQLYHQLRTGNDNHEGQAIRFVISGSHIGHEWVLQYLEAHGTPITGDPLKRFEG